MNYLDSFTDRNWLVSTRTNEFVSLFSWPVRTLSFSHDGQMIASGSEDLLIDIVSNVLRS